MYLRSDQRGPQINKGLAVRIACLGALALALFAVLFLRLWYLQVLNGKHYLAEARDNRTREFRLSAPRGSILFRTGRVILDNRSGRYLGSRQGQMSLP